MNKDFQRWAQAVMALPNLCFVVLDTTGLQRDADIIQVLVADANGKEIFKRLVQPGRYIGENNMRYTGITSKDLNSAPPIHDVWQEITAALTGRFFLAYGLDFVQERLDENAHYHKLQAPFLVGDCLQHTAVEYFKSGYNLKLTDAANRIGHTMFIPAMAQERIAAQRALLSAMAKGLTSIYDDPDLDDHPF